MEHQEQIASKETKIAEKMQTEIQKIQATSDRQIAKYVESIQLLQQKVQTLQQPSLHTPPMPDYSQPMNNESFIGLLSSTLAHNLKQSTALHKEHYISNDGKDPKEFNKWLDNVDRISRISSKDHLDIAISTSIGQLYKYISELTDSGLNWDMIKHLDKTTLTGLLEQASDHTIVFQQNFEVNYYTLLKFSLSTLDSTLTMTNLFKDYEWYLDFVGLTFAFALVLDIDQDDYPVLRNLMFPLRDSVEKLASCYDNLQHFLVVTQPSATGTMTAQIETEEQATQDNAPPTPSDTPIHPVVHPDSEPEFEHDPELDSEDQNILAIKSTDTLDNPINNSDPTFDVLNSSISDCTDCNQTIDNSDIGDPDESKTETINDNTQHTKQNTMPKKVIKTEAPKDDIMTVNLNTQDTQLNPKPNPMPKKTMTPRCKSKRIKKSGKVQKIQSPGVHKMKFKSSHRNERIYWSKQLCHVNNLIHDSNSFALHNLYHMVTPDVSGLHTVIYPQNMWLLKRPRIKIK